MNNDLKIRLVDNIIELVKESQTSNDMPIMVGELNKPQGIKGFITADVGHPVFEYKEKYIIYLERLDGKLTVEVPYYRDTLYPCIKFNKQCN